MASMAVPVLIVGRFVLTLVWLMVVLSDFFGAHEMKQNQQGMQRIAKDSSTSTTAAPQKCSATVLDFSDRRLGASGVQNVLLPALEQSACTLHALYLGDNQLDAEAISHLVVALRELRALDTLDLGSNRIGIHDESAMRILGTALRELTSLHTLDLSRNFIGGLTALSQHLGRALRGLTVLHTLDLSANQLGSRSMRELAPALRALRSLTTLDLSDNRLNVTAMQHLAPALSELTSLRGLNLSFNRLNNAAIQELAPALRQLLALETLYINDNPLDGGALQHLAPVLLRELPVLETLRMVPEFDLDVLRAASCVAVRWTRAANRSVVKGKGSNVQSPSSDDDGVCGMWLLASSGGCCCPLPCCSRKEPPHSNSHDCRLRDFIRKFPGAAVVASLSLDEVGDPSRCLLLPSLVVKAFGGCCGDDCFLSGLSWMEGVDLGPIEHWSVIGSGFLKDCVSLAQLVV